MKIERLTPALGAEIDIDLGNITADGAQAVYDALMVHQVVFFRDQQMTPEQHIELAKHFGEIDVPHPVYQSTQKFLLLRYLRTMPIGRPILMTGTRI